MASVRGTGLLILKKVFQEKKPKKETYFLKLLTEDERNIYQMASPSNWISIFDAERIYTKSMQALHWRPSRGLRYIGSRMAKDNLNSIYKFLLTFVTLPLLLKRAALFWHTYHNEGSIEVENISPHECIFKVKSYPMLPESIRLVATGYIDQLCRLSGAKGVLVKWNFSDPQEWKWQVSWD